MTSSDEALTSEFHKHILTLAPIPHADDSFVKIWAREVPASFFEMGSTEDSTEYEWLTTLRHLGYLYAYKTLVAWQPWEEGSGAKALKACLSLGREIGASVDNDPSIAFGTYNTLCANFLHQIGLRVSRWFHDFEGTSMPDPASHSGTLREAIKLWGRTLIDAARSDVSNAEHAKMPLPVVYGSWRMNVEEMPGYFAEYGTYAGFNKGIYTYYFENFLPPNKHPVTLKLAKLASTIAQSEREGAGRWQAAWVGNSWPANPKPEELLQPATPTNYQALVTFMVLAGVNDLVFFPMGAYSVRYDDVENNGSTLNPQDFSIKGHFGPANTPATQHEHLARINAEVFHNACLAAKRFQPFAASLANSKVHLCLTDGSAEAAGNVARFTTTKEYGNFQIKLPDLETIKGKLGEGKHKLVISADIKCISPGGVAWNTKEIQTNTPWIRQLAIFTEDDITKAKNTLQFDTWYDTAAQKATVESNLFVRRRSNPITIKIVTTCTNVKAREIQVNSIKEIHLKWEFAPGIGATQIVDFDNIKLLKIDDANNANTDVPLHEWHFDGELPTEALKAGVPPVGQDDNGVALSDAIAGPSPNGVTGLAIDGVLLSRRNAQTGEYWFAAMKVAGSQTVSVPLPLPAGYVTNTVSHEYWELNDQPQFSLPVNQSGDLHYFGPRVCAPIKLLPSGAMIPVWPEEAVPVAGLRPYAVMCLYSSSGTPGLSTHLKLALSWFDASSNLLATHDLMAFPNKTQTMTPFQDLVISPVGAAHLLVKLKAIGGNVKVEELHVKPANRNEKLINRNFEAGSGTTLPGWTLETHVVANESATATLASDQKRSGSQCVKLSVNGNSSYANLRSNFSDQPGAALRLEENTDYELSYWVRGTGVVGTDLNGTPPKEGVNSRIALYSRTSPDWALTSALVKHAVLTQSFDWTRVRHTFNSGIATYAVVHLQLRHVAGTIWIDDVTLRKQSLICDGKFEHVTGNLPDHWTLSIPDEKSSATLERGLDGKNSVRLEVTNPLGVAYIASYGPEGVLSLVEPGSDYEFSFYAKGENLDTTGESINLRLWLTDTDVNWRLKDCGPNSDDPNFIVTKFNNHGTFDWKKITFTFMTSSTQHYCFAYLQLRKTLGKIWVNRIELKKK